MAPTQKETPLGWLPRETGEKGRGDDAFYFSLARSLVSRPGFLINVPPRQSGQKDGWDLHLSSTVYASSGKSPPTSLSLGFIIYKMG